MNVAGSAEALYCAIVRRSLPAVRAALAAGADPNEPLERLEPGPSVGTTDEARRRLEAPLVHALRRWGAVAPEAAADLVAALLAAGASVEQGDNEVTVPLHVAAQQYARPGVADGGDRHRLLKLLLAACDDLPALEARARCSVLGAAALPFFCEPPLSEPVAEAFQERIRFLLAAGARPQPREMCVAAGLGLHEALRLLLAAGGDANSSWMGIPPLQAIMYMGDNLPVEAAVSTAVLLLDAGGDPDGQYSDKWRASILNRSSIPLPMVELLLARGADVNHRDSCNNTSLHAHANNPELLALLLAQPSADVHAVSDNGRTPLHFAACQPEGGAEGAALLLRAGASVHVRDFSGNTPLHYAARYGSTATVELLLRHGADPDASGKHGASPLLKARRLEPLKALLAGGADVKCRVPAGDSTMPLLSPKAPPSVWRLLMEASGLPVQQLRELAPAAPIAHRGLSAAQWVDDLWQLWVGGQGEFVQAVLDVGRAAGWLAELGIRNVVEAGCKSQSKGYALAGVAAGEKLDEFVQMALRLFGSGDLIDEADAGLFAAFGRSKDCSEAVAVAVARASLDAGADPNRSLTIRRPPPETAGHRMMAPVELALERNAPMGVLELLIQYGAKVVSRDGRKMLFELVWHRPRLASSVMDAHPLLRVPEDALAGSAPLEAVVFMLDSGACEWEAATAAVAALHFPVMEYLFFERCVPLERQERICGENETVAVTNAPRMKALLALERGEAGASAALARMCEALADIDALGLPEGMRPEEVLAAVEHHWGRRSVKATLREAQASASQHWPGTSAPPAAVGDAPPEEAPAGGDPRKCRQM